MKMNSIKFDLNKNNYNIKNISIFIKLTKYNILLIFANPC